MNAKIARYIVMFLAAEDFGVALAFLNYGMYKQALYWFFAGCLTGVASTL